MWRWSGVPDNSCSPIFFSKDVMSYDHDSSGRYKKREATRRYMHREGSSFLKHIEMHGIVCPLLSPIITRSLPMRDPTSRWSGVVI
jgi:hypothetical protein